MRGAKWLYEPLCVLILAGGMLLACDGTVLMGAPPSSPQQPRIPRPTSHLKASR